MSSSTSDTPNTPAPPRPTYPQAESRARDLLAYIGHAPTPFHAVEETTRRLEAQGFRSLRPADRWTLEASDRAFAVLQGSTLVAFVVGQKSPVEGGFTIVGAHTDSPCLKLKPTPELRRHGYLQLGVEVYGGVLLSTWLDRDLSLAGRVAIRGVGPMIETRLVDFRRPLARIPSLAIHLNRSVNQDGLKLNPQDHLPPILGLDGGVGLEGKGAKGLARDVFASSLASEAGVPSEQILDHDLFLYDAQVGQLAGADLEFIHSGRLDNLASCHAAVSALLESKATQSASTRVVALYDHEEVGSRSAQGAQGPFLEATLRRIIDACGADPRQAFERAMAASFFVSTDMAHAIHPNYADRHDAGHAPVLGGGPVIKMNAGQSYATDGATAARFAAHCRDAGIEPQRFVVRSDLPCGSTIGPITAARLGISSVDVGSPMLSMHSCREMAGTQDTESMVRVLRRIFEA